MTNQKIVAECPHCGTGYTDDAMRLLLTSTHSARKRKVVEMPCCHHEVNLDEIKSLWVVAECPKCITGYTYDAMRVLWAKANRGIQLDHYAVEMPCCNEQVPLEEIKSMWGRATNAQRVNPVAGPGRPLDPDRCPCGRYTKARAAKRKHIC